MERKNFLKKLSFLSLSPLLFTKTLKADTESWVYEITDECVSCGACVDESANEIIEEIDGDNYIFNIGSGCVSMAWDNGKRASIGCCDEMEDLIDVCPVNAIVEIS